MTLGPWLRFFRLPNLPTAPGDALVGAAVLMAFDGGDEVKALVAGLAAFCFYLFGLADNDLAGAADDAVNAPERPLPKGEISRCAAQFARATCLFVALLAGAVADLPPAWWLTVTLLTGAICIYNRFKGTWMMGLCRGLSVLAGGAAVLRPKMPLGTTFAEVPGLATGLAALLGVAFGWTLYVTAITWLSEGEERPSGGIGCSRWWLGLTALVPALSLAVIPYLLPAAVREPVNWRIAVLPLVGTLWTFAHWCVAVRPLGRPHDSSMRRAAVGRTIGALLYLQIGFLLMFSSRAFIAVAVGCWLAARLIRRWAPSVRGS